MAGEMEGALLTENIGEDIHERRGAQEIGLLPNGGRRRAFD